MKIAICGHNGFLGSLTKEYFINLGYDIVEIDRKDFVIENALKMKFSDVDIVVNFIGAPIIKRWTEKTKQKIIESRVNSVSKIIGAICEVNINIFLLQASAIGIYDLSHNHDENRFFYDNNFLAYVVKSWEKSLVESNSFHNYCLFRLGIVIDSKGGYLSNVIKSLRFKVSTYFGKRKGNFSFIDSTDFLSAINFIIENKITGTVNLVSPEVTDNYSVANNLRIIYKTWILFRVPDFVLKLIFGEGFYVLKETPAVFPKRLLDCGFSFKYKKIEDSLKHHCKEIEPY